MVLLRSGGNDLWAGKSVEQVFADTKEFVRTVHEQLPETEIVYISLSPSIARWSQHEKEKALNALVADFFTDKPYLKYVETYDLAPGANGEPRPELFVSDKLHFNDAGYHLLRERLWSVVFHMRLKN